VTSIAAGEPGDRGAEVTDLRRSTQRRRALTRELQATLEVQAAELKVLTKRVKRHRKLLARLEADLEKLSEEHRIARERVPEVPSGG
jgi:septal ring factor EnvC (AmiA/AmiB activator)